MIYGDGPLNKYEYACTLASSLAYLVLKQQDAIGCLAFDDQLRTRIPTRSKRTHLQAIIDALAICEPRDKTDIYSILREAAETTPRRGMMIVVSDLLADAQRTLRGLRLLRQRGNDVLVLHVMDDDELDFPFNGPVRFDGLETGDHLNCNPRALREGYLAAMGDFLDELRRGCAGSTIDYSLIRTSQPLDAALASYLSSRLGMHHRN
jgi:uncharacterized protein (DUF58 family)